MVFDPELLAKLEYALKGPLPGSSAHVKMVNYDRPSIERALQQNIDATPSAVLVLLYPKNGRLHTLLMLRTPYEGVHGSQVSFPGGKKEKIDKDLLETALRETQEEFGIKTDQLKILGQLTDVFIPPSKFLVTPYVAFTEDPGKISPDPIEVAEVIETPLLDLLNDDSVKEKKLFVRTVNSKIKVKYFDVNGHVVWGATAMMISELREVLREL